MNGTTEQPRRRSPIEEILASRRQEGQAGDASLASRYGDGLREQREREQVRESYLAMDVRFRDGSLRGFFYFDVSGSPTLDASHTVLTIPFREATLVIHGHRLLDLYREVLHHSLDVIQESHRPEFASGDAPVIAAIEVRDEEGEG